MNLRLRDARKALGLTQKALADKINCHWQYLSHIESGVATPSVGLVERLIKEMGATEPEELGFTWIEKRAVGRYNPCSESLCGSIGL